MKGIKGNGSSNGANKPKGTYACKANRGGVKSATAKSGGKTTGKKW